MAEEIDRHTPLGYFNFAASYRTAGDKLRTCKLKATHGYAPVTFLLYHSIELYLKAFLRLHGVSASKLQDIGHKFGKLQARVTDLGLPLMDEDKEILELMAFSDAWSRSRYLMIGPMRRPSIPALSRTCRSLDRCVGEALQRAGVRLNPPTKSKPVGD